MALNPIRWKQRLQNFQKAIARLDKACQQKSYNELELAGLIQTFEFSFELAWKTLKDLLEFEGYDASSPRSAIRTALEAKHITAEQCETLLDALGKRNLLTHTYDEENAIEAKRLILDEYSPTLSYLSDYLTNKSENE